MCNKLALPLFVLSILKGSVCSGCTQWVCTRSLSMFQPVWLVRLCRVCSCWSSGKISRLKRKKKLPPPPCLKGAMRPNEGARAGGRNPISVLAANQIFTLPASPPPRLPASPPNLFHLRLPAHDYIDIKLSLTYNIHRINIFVIIKISKYNHLSLFNSKVTKPTLLNYL